MKSGGLSMTDVPGGATGYNIPAEADPPKTAANPKDAATVMTEYFMMSSRRK
jgi:hypothetical protein